MCAYQSGRFAGIHSSGGCSGENQKKLYLYLLALKESSFTVAKNELVVLWLDCKKTSDDLLINDEQRHAEPNPRDLDKNIS